MKSETNHLAKYHPKEVLVGRVERGAKLAQIVIKMADTVGAAASVNTLLASLKVDVRQSMTYANSHEHTAIYNAFVVLTDPAVSLEQVSGRLKLSQFVEEVQAFEGVQGSVVDMISFPVTWQGRRVVILAQYAMARMLEGIRGLLGTGGHVILYELGMDYGKELANYFVNRLGREYLLNNYPYWLNVLAATGWGIPEKRGSGDDFPNATIRLASCVECEGRSSKEAACSFVRGFLAGVFSELAGHAVHCEETQCSAKGEHHCEFQLRSGKALLVR